MDRQLAHHSFKGGGFTTDSSSMASSEGLNEDPFESQRNDSKRKSRNLNEKKRRDQFNDLINALHSLIDDDDCVTSSASSHKKVDKSSVLKSTIAYLQKFKNFAKCDENSEEKRNDLYRPSFLTKDEYIQLMLEATDAFVLMIEATPEANIMYASQSILPLLGLSPSKFCKSINEESAGVITNGISLYDIIHESQVNELKSIINEMKHEQISLTLYLKQNHINDSNKKCSYELSGLLGVLTVANDPLTMSTHNCFVFIAKFLRPKFLKEIHLFNEQHLKSNEFVSRYSLEWKFLYVDHRASKWIGYLPFELLGTSGYDYYHWDDLSAVIEGHERLMQKGEETSCDYRFLIKGQQWLWLRTKYVITYNQWNSKPEFIQCTHSVICFDSKNEQHQQQQKHSRRPHSDSVVLPKRFNSRFKPYRKAMSIATATTSSDQSSLKMKSFSSSSVNTCHYYTPAMNANVCTYNLDSPEQQQPHSQQQQHPSHQSEQHSLTVYQYLQNQQKMLKEKIDSQACELNRVIEQLNVIESQMICGNQITDHLTCFDQSTSTLPKQQQQQHQQQQQSLQFVNENESTQRIHHFE